MLRQGNLSHRGIAEQLGIGRNVVGRVAAGNVTSADRQAREDKQRAAGDVTAEFRCPRCGGSNRAV